MKVICVIPARYASTRLPGKPLAMIGDKPMIQWVYEAASQVENIDTVLVATDNDRVYNRVISFGGKVVKTADDIPSGTDRVYEATKNEEVDIIVNLQGDEPFIKPVVLRDLINSFKNKDILIATPVCRISDQSEINNPNIVKVVRNLKGFALYFSRSALPHFRDSNSKIVLEYHTYFKHIGIYAYRKECLAQLARLRESALEKAEKLEQLRFLENGYQIYTLLTDYNSVGVDTKDDLEKVNRMLQLKN